MHERSLPLLLLLLLLLPLVAHAAPLTCASSGQASVECGAAKAKYDVCCAGHECQRRKCVEIVVATPPPPPPPVVVTNAPPEAIAAQPVYEAFAAVRQAHTSVFPLTGASFSDTSSTFGPRIKASTDAYDFHRGMDISCTVGTPIVAPQDGLYWGERTYTTGGLTARIRHAFPQPFVYHGETFEYYYTFFMHMDSVEPSLVERETLITAGQVIGTCGESGVVVSPHMHLEVRAGVYCSQEYGIQNPTSTCAWADFDPHWHPYVLFDAPPAPTLSLTLGTAPAANADGEVVVDMPGDGAVFNRVAVTVVAQDNTVAASHVLDLNERLGFDASSEAAIDAVDTTRPYIAPVVFSHPTHHFPIVIPSVFLPNDYDPAAYTIFVDVWDTFAALPASLSIP